MELQSCRLFFLGSLEFKINSHWNRYPLKMFKRNSFVSFSKFFFTKNSTETFFESSGFCFKLNEILFITLVTFVDKYTEFFFFLKFE